MAILGLLSGARAAVSGINLIRVGLIAGLAAALFVGGCMYSDKKHAERDAQRATETAAEIARLSQEHAEKMRQLAIVAADNERAFNADIDEIRVHRDALLEQIRVVALTKPPPEVRIEACLEGDEDVQIVVANPFSDSFRVLWNQASRDIRPAGSTGAASP
jgi:hypothetical protein